MSRTSEILNTVRSPDQIFKLLYITGYRLTANHQLTAELIDASISALNLQGRQGHNKLLKGLIRTLSGSNNIGVKAILKALCTAFINKTTVQCGRDHVTTPLPIYEDFCKPQIQEALLHLPPMERLLVVLKDILGLTYAEMADLTGLEKSDVSCLLSVGRLSLRELLDDRWLKAYT